MENGSRPQYRDPERCRKCGGFCCFIYIGGSSEDVFRAWVKQLDDDFARTGADKTPPLFDSLEAHFNESVRKEVIARGLNPDQCKYLGKEGCILPWDVRPLCCREHRCNAWKEEDLKNIWIT